MPDTYDSGVEAGRVLARLEGHDKHFEKINGSLDRLAALELKRLDETGRLTLSIQRLADQAEAAGRTVLATAAALKDADEARRKISTGRWVPLSRLALALGILLTAINLIVLVGQFVVSP